MVLLGQVPVVRYVTVYVAPLIEAERSISPVTVFKLKFPVGSENTPPNNPVITGRGSTASTQ